MTYQLEISSTTRREIKKLPGNIRQRVRRSIRALSDNPRPHDSKRLDFALEAGEARRIRLDRWRIVYAVIETDYRVVAIVAVRRRPPYDYQNLQGLFSYLD